MNNRKRVGLYLIEKHEVKHSIELARMAEENGFDCVWQGEEYPPFRNTRDSLIPLGAIAAVTKSIKLGTGVLHTSTERNDAGEYIRDVGRTVEWSRHVRDRYSLAADGQHGRH